MRITKVQALYKLAFCSAPTPEIAIAGATFTARMQPLIEKGGQMELYFSCADLVQMWVVKTFGHPKSLTSPTPYVLVKERNEVRLQ